MSAAAIVAPAPTHASLLKLARGVFDGLPDGRRKSNATKYEMGDAALSAFSVFFTQSPSFLDWQTRMQLAKGANNGNSIFGIHKIPSDAQIRNLLDPVSPETLFPLMAHLGDALFDQGHLDSYRSIGGIFLVAVDGTDFFSSENISCRCCTETKHKDGSRLFRHIAVTPVIVGPGHDKVVALAQDLPALARVRQQLRGEMQCSVLMDVAGFARSVEQAYQQMFAAWCKTP